MGFGIIERFYLYPAATWATNTQVLKTYEAGLETDTGKVKVGDGLQAFASLAYLPGFGGGGGGGGDMLAANNLSDVVSALSSRLNIMPAITGESLKYIRVNAAETDFEYVTLAGGGDMLTTNNLSDLTNVVTARSNLGLGSLATQSGTFSGTSSGTNTGDQTSIVGVTGTKAQFDTACSDGNFLFVGDAVTSESDPVFAASPAGSINSNMGDAITGANTPSAGNVFATMADVAAFVTPDGDYGDISVASNVWTIDNSVVTFAKMQSLSSPNLLLGTGTGGTTVEEIALGTGLSMTASTLSVTGFQPSDATLTSIALLGTAADKMLYTTGVDTWAEADITAFARTMLDDAAATNVLSTLGATAIGKSIFGTVSAGAVRYIRINADDSITLLATPTMLAALGGQPGDAGLTSLAGLTAGANSIIYSTATDAYAVLTQNTTATRKFLMEVSSSAPIWDTLVAGDVPTLNQNTTGSAATLTTSRNIGGVAFNGSADIVPQTIESANEATDTTCFLLFITASGTQQLQPKNNTGLTYNSNTNAVAATTFVGALTGNATTATALATPRTIGGVSFDGSGNIVPQTIQTINEATDTTCFVLFVSASGTQSLQPLNNTALTFNSNTGLLGATNVAVTDEAYGSTWNGSVNVPTKNAIFDMMNSTTGVNTSPTANGTTTITHGLGRIPTIIRIYGIGTFTSNAAATPTTISIGTYSSSGNRCVYQAYNTAAITTTQAAATSSTFSINLQTGANSFITGVIGNVGATTFDIVWTETGTASAQSYMWEAE